MSWIAVGVAGGSALLKFGEGEIQKGQANKIDSQNQYPTAPVQSEYTANVRDAQQMAQQGMPAQQYNNQVSAINRNQAGGLYAAGNSANPTANIASIVRAGNDSNSNLNAQDAVQRNNNMLNLLRERQTLAQQKDKAWDWNYQQKYLGNLAKSNALRGASNQNINSGLNEVEGTALTGAKLGAFNSTGGGTGGADNTYIPQGTAESMQVPQNMWGTF